MFKNLHRIEREYPTDSFFDYLAVSALWSHFVPHHVQYFLLIASKIQILSILLWGQLQLVVTLDDVGLLRSLHNLFEILAARKFFTPNITIDSIGTFNPFLIGAGAYFLSFFVALSIVLKNFYRKQKNTAFEAVFITTIGQLHLSMGFWIANSILLETLFVNTSSFEGINNLVIVIPVLLLIILNYLIGAFYSIFAYYPFAQSNLLSTHTPLFQMSNYLFKAVISLAINFSDDQQVTGWSFTVLSFVILGFQYYKLITTFPYYEYQPMRAMLMFSSLFLLISGMSLFMFAMDSFSPQSMAYIETFLVIMTLVSTRNSFNKVVKKYLSMDIRRLKSEHDVLKKVFAIRYLFSKAKMTMCSNRLPTRHELDFWGMWSSLIRKQKIEMEVEGIINEASMTQSLRKYYTECEKNVINSILKDAIRELKRTDKLKIMLCNLSLEHNEQVSTSIHNFTLISKPQGLNRIVTLKLHQKIQQKVYSFFQGELVNERTLDLKSYMDLEAVSVCFLQMICSNARKFVSFWDGFKKSGTKMKELYNIQSKIEQNADDVLTFWKHHIEGNKVFAGSLNTTYSIYLALVRNSPGLGRKTFEKYNSLNLHALKIYQEEGPLSQQNISSPNNITFHASMARDKLGRILNVSPNITELLGWMPEDLKGVNISMIVPNFMQKRHDVALLEHLDKLSLGIPSYRLYKNLITFVKDRAGYKVPCYVYLSLYPYIHGELIYTAIVRLNKSDDKIILVDKDGNIEGFTRDIGEHFRLDPNKTTKIKDLCSNYKVLERALDNLSRLINQQPATDCNHIVADPGSILKRDVENKLDEQEDVLAEFSSHLSQTIKVNLFSLGDDFLRKNNIPTVYSIHITPRKFWDSHYFVLKLKEQGPKDGRKGTTMTCPSPKELTTISQSPKSKDEPLFEVPNELSKLGDEPLTGPSTLTAPCQALLRTAFTTTYIQKMHSTNKRKEYLVSKPSLPSDANPTKEIKVNTNNNFLNVNINVIEEDKRSYRSHKIVKKHKEGILDVFDVDLTNSTASTKGSRYNSKLEEAVYATPKDRRLGLIKILTIVFVLITSGILVGFGIKCSNVLSLGQENAGMINKSLLLLAEVCEINRVVRLHKILTTESLFNMTLADRSRYQTAGLNVSTLGKLQGLLYERMVMLSVVNNMLRLAIDKVDTEIEKEIFYNHIPVDMSVDQITGFNRSSNLFDLATEIQTNAIKIFSTRFKDTQARDFILTNSLNNILSYGENITRMLVKNSDLNLQRLLNLNLILIVCMAVFCVCLLCFNVGFIRVFLKKRKRLIDILERLDINQVEKHVSWVARFANVLEENSMDSKKVNIRLEKENFSTVTVKKNSAKSSKKTFDTRGINETLIRFSFAKALLILLMFSAFIIIYVHSQNQSKLLETDIGLILSSTSYIYQFDLLLTIFYQYIEENGTSQVRNHPIEQEWDLIVNDISQAQTFLLTVFLQKNDQTEARLPIQEMFRGNLCNAMGLKDPQSVMLCNEIAAGVMQKGLIGVASFTLDTLEMAKNVFDEHLKSDQEKMQIFMIKNLIALEVIVNNFGSPMYLEFTRRIETYTKNHYEQMDTDMRNIIIVFVAFCVLFGALILVFVEKGLENEVNGWRKILRLIPCEIISHNKMLKNYVASNSNGILRAVKKSL